MIREVSLPTADISIIREQMSIVQTSDDLVVFRQGTNRIDNDRWIALLENECGLIPDRRHFDPQWAANDAHRNYLKHIGTHRGESLNSDKNEKQAQIKPANWWEISYQPAREIAYAYSKTPQPLHTDNAWFGDPAEVNFFIMAKQALAGGEQTIYTLSRLLEDLAIDEPGLLNDLTSVKVTIMKGDQNFFNRTTIIRLEPCPAIFWNYYRTEKSSPEVVSMCEAFFKYLARRLETSSVQQLHCETGDCFSFNDLKMLHGRTAFEAKNERDRVLLHSMWKLPQTNFLGSGVTQYTPP